MPTLAEQFDQLRTEAEGRRQAAVALAREQFSTLKQAAFAVYQNSKAAVTARFDRVKDIDTVVANAIDAANAQAAAAKAAVDAAQTAKAAADAAALPDPSTKAVDPAAVADAAVKAKAVDVANAAAADAAKAADPVAIEAGIRAEEANARAALNAIGDFDDKPLRNQLGAAIDAADATYHAEVRAAAASLGVSTDIGV